MNKLLLALLAIPTLANATGNHLQPTGSDNYNSLTQRQHQSINNAVEVQGASVGGISNASAGGNVGISNDYSDLRIVPPAISPNINTNVICPMVMQGSKAGSVFFFSGSGTHAPDIVPICVAWHLGQKDVVERMTCAASKEYAKANPACK